MILDLRVSLYFFFFNDTATTEIYTLSLHDALPICRSPSSSRSPRPAPSGSQSTGRRPTAPPGSTRTWSGAPSPDRKSTRLNSSHANISYAVFCLKKKKKLQYQLCSIVQDENLIIVD